MTQKQQLQSAGDGTAVPAGYAGEQRRVTYSGVTINTTITQIAVINNVTPGIYLVRFAGDSGLGTTTRIIYNLNTSVVADNSQAGETFWDACSTPSAATALSVQGMRYLVVTNTIANYYLIATATNAASTGARGIFELIRIA